jgi:hypothetical protein
VYQSTAYVETDAPSEWPRFWCQQLRWGRSSQRETLLCLRWLWRRPIAFCCFATDIITPFAVYAVVVVALAHGLGGTRDEGGLSPALELPLGYAGMIVSIGLRQVAHLRRVPRDIRRLPLFALQITFLMVPIRLCAFATMFHQGWRSRSDEPHRSAVRAALVTSESGS